eukprot:ANDGO_04690.mRNA.2 hypothetical protein
MHNAKYRNLMHSWSTQRADTTAEVLSIIHRLRSITDDSQQKRRRRRRREAGRNAKKESSRHRSSDGGCGNRAFVQGQDQDQDGEDASEWEYDDEDRGGGGIGGYSGDLRGDDDDSDNSVDSDDLEKQIETENGERYDMDALDDKLKDRGRARARLSAATMQATVNGDRLMEALEDVAADRDWLQDSVSGVVKSALVIGNVFRERERAEEVTLERVRVEYELLISRTRLEAVDEYKAQMAAKSRDRSTQTPKVAPMPGFKTVVLRPAVRAPTVGAAAGAAEHVVADCGFTGIEEKAMNTDENIFEAYLAQRERERIGKIQGSGGGSFVLNRHGRTGSVIAGLVSSSSSPSSSASGPNGNAMPRGSAGHHPLQQQQQQQQHQHQHQQLHGQQASRSSPGAGESMVGGVQQAGNDSDHGFGEPVKEGGERMHSFFPISTIDPSFGTSVAVQIVKGHNESNRDIVSPSCAVDSLPSSPTPTSIACTSNPQKEENGTADDAGEAAKSPVFPAVPPIPPIQQDETPKKTLPARKSGFASLLMAAAAANGATASGAVSGPTERSLAASEAEPSGDNGTASPQKSIASPLGAKLRSLIRQATVQHKAQQSAFSAMNSGTEGSNGSPTPLAVPFDETAARADERLKLAAEIEALADKYLHERHIRSIAEAEITRYRLQLAKERDKVKDVMLTYKKMREKMRNVEKELIRWKKMNPSVQIADADGNMSDPAFDVFEEDGSRKLELSDVERRPVLLSQQGRNPLQAGLNDVAAACGQPLTLPFVSPPSASGGGLSGWNAGNVVSLHFPARKTFSFQDAVGFAQAAGGGRSVSPTAVQLPGIKKWGALMRQMQQHQHQQ